MIVKKLTDRIRYPKKELVSLMYKFLLTNIMKKNVMKAKQRRIT